MSDERPNPIVLSTDGLHSPPSTLYNFIEDHSSADDPGKPFRFLDATDYLRGHRNILWALPQEREHSAQLSKLVLTTG